MQKREKEQRRKLQQFLNDLALLGSLQVSERTSRLQETDAIIFFYIFFISQGFKYFQPWLRGKEELLLTVVNEDLVSFLQEQKTKPLVLTDLSVFVPWPVLQGWRSPGFVVSRASSSSSTNSCNSSDVSTSSSSPSLDSRSSSPLPREPAGPQSDTGAKTQPQTTGWQQKISFTNAFLRVTSCLDWTAIR